MKKVLLSFQSRRFIFHIGLPVILVGVLFILAIFLFIIPSMETQLIERKKETIREVAMVGWSVLEDFYNKEISGELTRDEAQSLAAEMVGSMRYGPESKDYYWITDTHPNMIVHPYRQELNGQDLSEFEDSKGKRLFVEFVEAVSDDGVGYVEYYWQWKDDPYQVVPKLSYVVLFEPWDWVIGTGIYIEDVQQDIDKIEQDLMYASAGISVIMFLFLSYVLRQSYRIEQQRTKAEKALKESHEKFRTLVESSTEGTLLVLDGYCSYSNKIMTDLLKMDDQVLTSRKIIDLLMKETHLDEQALQNIGILLKGGTVRHQFEARMKDVDGNPVEILLTATRVSFAGKSGFVLIAREAKQIQQLQTSLQFSRRQEENMIDIIDLCFFQASWRSERAVLLDANPAMRRLLEIEEKGDLVHLDLLELIESPTTRMSIINKLNSERKVSGIQFTLQSTKGKSRVVSIYAILITGENGGLQYLEGILEDVSEQKQLELNQKEIMADLQSSVLALENPIREVMLQPVSCKMNQSIRETASLMQQSDLSAAIVQGPGGELIGVVTDHDLRERVLAEGVSPDRPVYEILSAPLSWISEQALVYEAILFMQEKNISCLAVKNTQGKLVGVIRHRDLLQYRQHAAMILCNRIRYAENAEQIKSVYRQLPFLVSAMIDNGSRIRHINRIISSISDTIVNRLLELAIDEIGKPPVAFSFLSLGSEGREEQTLVTDQDNAILYDDPPAINKRSTEEYFTKLGKIVCDNLNDIGFVYCKGGIMAKYSRWNQPLSVWKENFKKWIHNANPQELLELNMLFDFRSVNGETELTSNLRQWIFNQSEAWQNFFIHFAQNTQLYRPPIGLFGNILTESYGKGAKALNLKEAVMPVVNYARLYALKYQIIETHTIDRLQQLKDIGRLSRELFEDLLPAYEAAMRLRLRNQANAILTNREADNLIAPEEWTELDEIMLKRLFSLLNNLRKKISYDFLGGAG